jgi:RNA polymerase sigma-70 factor (ECF subfamily)
VYFSKDEDDATLIRRVLDGETAAFEVLVERYQRVLYTVALRMLGNRDDAKDATQTAFVRAYERLASFDEQYRFFSWIYRILVNECLNVIRGRRPEDELTPVLATPAARSNRRLARASGAGPGGAAAAHAGVPGRRRAAALRGAFVRRNGRCARRAGKDGEIAPVFGAAAAGRTAARVEGIMTERPGDDMPVQTQHEELDRLLDALGPAEAPADLLANVMLQVKATTPAAATSRTAMHEHRDNLTDGGTGMGKKVMWGLAAAAAWR